MKTHEINQEMTTELVPMEQFAGQDPNGWGKVQSIQFARQNFDAEHIVNNERFGGCGLNEVEAAALYDVLELMGTGTIVELGRSFGCSTRVFYQHVARHAGSLHSYDLVLFESLMDRHRKTGFPLDGHVNVQIQVGDSMKVQWDEGWPIDFLFIDTEHSLADALGEYMRWRVYLSPGAFIAFHDSNLPPVARAIEIVKEV